MKFQERVLNYFLGFSNKSIVFLLLVKIWTDVLLPNPYKDSDLVFFIFVLFVNLYFYLAFSVLRRYEPISQRVVIAFGLLSLALTLNSFIYWILGLNINYLNGFHVGYWVGLSYLIIMGLFSYYLLKSENHLRVSLFSISTFSMVVFIPIGAYWIHKRIQRIAHKIDFTDIEK